MDEFVEAFPIANIVGVNKEPDSCSAFAGLVQDVKEHGRVLNPVLIHKATSTLLISVTDSAVIVRALIPLFAPGQRRAAMCEAISLANWQLRFARFEMDAGDGELRCRADMPLYDGVPTDEQLTRLMYCVWNITERYAPALVEVMTGQADPEVAIARVERPEIEPIRRKQETDLTVN